MSVAVVNVPMALEDSVVWYNLKLRGYPRWPCKITSSPDSEGLVTLESFEDHKEYRERSDKLIPFIHADLGKSCAKDVAKCQQRPATLDQYRRAVREAIAFQKSKDPYFCLPFELEELCGPAHVSTPASTHTQDVSSHPAGLMSKTRRRTSSGAYAFIGQSQLSEGKKEELAACSPECESTKRKRKSRGIAGIQSELAACSPECESTKRKRKSRGIAGIQSGKKSLTNNSTLFGDPNTEASNANSNSCSAILSTAGAGGGCSGGCVLAGLEPSCGVQSHQSVGCVGVEGKLPTNHDESTVNGKGSSGQSPRGHPRATSVSTEGSEDSDDEILPSIDMTPQRSIRVKNLKGGEIIWAKYGRFPFWPAMVTSVNRYKMRALVAFLGWNVDEKRIGIANKNIAPFNYLQQEHYLQQGRSSQWAEMFSLAFEEANTLVREGTPAEQLMNVIARRPKNQQYMVSPMAELGRGLTIDGLATSTEEEKYSDEDNDDCVNTMEADSSSDEEQVSPEYRYSVLRAEFEAMKPELLAIVEGRVPSKLHTAYCHGSQQQKRAMTRSANFGPARKLPTKQQTQLLSFLETITGMATTESRFGHKYCCEVLFPEAMIRVVAKGKGVSLQDAAKEVLQEMDYL